MKAIQILLVIAIGAIFFVGCSRDDGGSDDVQFTDDNGNGNGNGCDTSFVPSFSEKVEPIFQNFCLGCHSASAPSGGIILSSNNAAKNNAAKILPAIKHEQGLPQSKRMPPGGKLTDCDILTIERWINSGFPE